MLGIGESAVNRFVADKTPIDAKLALVLEEVCHGREKLQNPSDFKLYHYRRPRRIEGRPGAL